jgi:hypothetical protein
METKGISAKQPCQTSPGCNDQRGDEKLTAPFTAKQEGCANTNKAEKNSNEKCQGVQS